MANTRPKQAVDDSRVDNWRREAILGSGAFGIISLWRNVNTDEKIALKQCRWVSGGSEGQAMGVSNQQRERWKQEVEIMHRLNHPNVVKALAVPPCLENPASDLPALGMEYCSGGDLRKMLSKPEFCNGLPEVMVRALLNQISSALLYLHSNRIIHRDLKPENVVVKPMSDGTIAYKLIDLGYCKELDQSSLASSFVGTLQYLAPELFISKQYTSAVDNWSFGLLAHETITGKRPFLPLMSPAQWIPIVSKKKSSDICAYTDSTSNKVIFSKEIASFNHVCPTLKSDLEGWLRLVLEWEPKKRGGKIAFQKLTDEILKKHLVQVFVLKTLQMFAYEISQETRMSELKILIESNCGVPCSEQVIVIPNARGAVHLVSGTTADNDLVSKHIDLSACHGNSIHDQVYPPVYLFHPSVHLTYSPYSTTSIIPPSVEDVLLNPTKLVTFEDLKNCWKAFIWVSQKLIEKFNSLSTSHEHLTKYVEGLKSKVKAKANSARTGLFILNAQADEIRKDIEHSVARLKENNNSFEHRGQKCTTTFLELCEQSLVDLAARERLVSQHRSLEEDMVGRLGNSTSQPPPANFRFDPLCCNSDLSGQTSSAATLDTKSNEAKIFDIYQSMLRMFNETRRKTKEDRVKHTKIAGSIFSFENTPAVKLICDLFQLIEKLVKRLYSELNVLLETVGKLNILSSGLESLDQAVKEATERIAAHRRSLFSSLWDLLVSAQCLDSETQVNIGSYSAALERVQQALVNLSLEQKQAQTLLETPELMRRRQESPGVLMHTGEHDGFSMVTAVSSTASSPASSDWAFLP